MNHTDTTARTARGGCLCGAVRYEIHGALRDVVNCHCEQCRRTHGHFSAYTKCTRSALKMTAADTLEWYASSATARRGFCATCGSSLFWEPSNGGGISIAAGTLDSPTGLHTIQQIFVDGAGDYYDLDDGLPRLPGSMSQ